VSRGVFRLFRRRRSLISIAGPLALVLVILCWAFLLAAGFALIYWGSFPADFRLNTGKDPAAERGFLSVFYFALEVLTTLGLGDFTPKLGLLRMVVTLQALIGFSLVTASVSWIVLIYPALGRKAALARRVSVLVLAEQRAGIGLISDGSEYLLGDLVLEVIRTRVDLIHFPITYYFHSFDERSSLPLAIPHLARFAEMGARPECDGKVRLTATALRAALDDLAELLQTRYIRIESKDAGDVFKAFAEYQCPLYEALERLGSRFGDSLVLFPGAATHTDSAHHHPAFFQGNPAGKDHDTPVVRNVNAEELIARLAEFGKLLCRNIKSPRGPGFVDRNINTTDPGIVHAHMSNQISTFVDHGDV
jgi:hypothetical protein